eukprot:gene16044-12500_t
MVLLKSALCIVAAFVACLWASQDFRTAMFQASLIYTPGTILRGSTHLLIEFAEFNHFGRAALTHGKGSRPSRKYYAAQDVLEGTASISRHKSLASLTSVAEIRELLGFLCDNSPILMNKEANAEAMIDRARIVSVDADADADADADVTSPHHSRLDGWDGEAWWIV